MNRLRYLTEHILRDLKKKMVFLGGPRQWGDDNSDLPEDPGARFENLVATHLLKRAQFLEDRTGDRYEIQFIRDKEKREVDFAVLKNDHLIELIEAKWSDREPSSSLSHWNNIG